MAELDGDNHAAAEPYSTRFEAPVASVDGRDVTLERTYFYAEGGGQPPDRGTLDGIDVVDVQSRDGETVHTLADEPTFGVGDEVAGRVDEDVRTYAMRAHTASHVVFGAGRRLFGAPGYGGFDIGEETVRLDFETGGAGETADAGDAADAANPAALDPFALQRLANEAVWESRAVDWHEMDAAAARADDDVVFNLGQDAAAAETVRVVEIDGWDVSACGGTHVRNTVEIGPIQVLDVSNPGADLVRVEYAVGERAIDEWIEERRSASRAATTLDTSVADLPGRVDGLDAENSDLRARVADLGERLLDARLSALAAETRSVDGAEWLVGAVDGVDANAAAEALEGVAGDHADVAVLAGRDGSTFVVVGTDGGTDASEVVADVTAEFGGGGGGGPTLAQGGGIDAPPQAVVDYLREE